MDNPADYKQTAKDLLKKPLQKFSINRMNYVFLGKTENGLYSYIYDLSEKEISVLQKIYHNRDSSNEISNPMIPIMFMLGNVTISLVD